MFKIEEVEIQDFRSHSSSKIIFGDGINVILGRNGAGKSSILEAIMVALYGARAARANKEALIRSGAKEYRITLKFKLDGEEYEIVRSSTGETFLRGAASLDGDQKVTEWISRRIPQHVFQNAVYVKQGEIESIVSDDESREKLIRKITKIEEYENAWKALGEIIRDFKKESEDYRSLLSQLKETFEQLNKKRAEEERAKKELEELKRKKDEIRKELEKARKDEEKFNEIGKKIEELRSEIEKIKVLIEQKEREIVEIDKDLRRIFERKVKLEKEVEEAKNLENKVKRFQEIDSLLKEIERIEKKMIELEKLEEKRKNLENELEKQKEIEKEIKNVEEKILELEKILKEFRDVEEKISEFETKKVQLKKLEEELLSFGDVEKLKQEIDRAKEEFEKIKDYEKKIGEKRASLKTRAVEIKKIVEQLKTADKKCPVCGRELTDAQKDSLLKNYIEDFKKIESELVNLSKLEEKVKEKRSFVEEVLKRESKLIIALQKIEEIKKLRSEVESYKIEELKLKKDSLEKVRTEKIELQGRYRTLKDVIKKEDVLREIERIEKNVNELREELKIAKPRTEKLEELKKEYESLKQSYSRWLEIKNSEKELENEKKIMDEKLKRKEIEERTLEDLKRRYKEVNEIYFEVSKGYNEELHKDLKKKVEFLTSEFSKAEEGIQRVQKVIQSIGEDIISLEKQIEKLRDLARKAEIIERNVVPELEKIREKFRNYKNIVAEASMREIEDIASKIFEELTDGKYNGIRLKRTLEKVEKIKIFVIYQGEEKDLTFLSGGELIALAIAFRLALTIFLVRGKIPVLILDEPTPFLDEERRKKLVEIISNYLRKIPQVIIVTHDEELKDAADRIIRVHAVGGISKVSYVES
ncbi:MAG: DNA double-strand break repair ATPase Rad50 [Archaeoglobaceae archaeon]|nr:DNA double-strand break repair ATPase Rad50 [Archaeoglobaceae archaeon]MCX8151531.1 DNA double-strand break repair ATPase Rad50 [Archaeoglobaceae archaeon]MDW8013233.1 DNA double-strand break repair ATPase Rad50 [Archaeoglobaceae archaeon]